MVVVRLLGLRNRHDPVAMLKAAGVTALCYFGIQQVPKHQQQEWAEWAFVKEPPFISSAAQPYVGLIVVCILVGSFILDRRQAIWRALFFDGAPKTGSQHSACVVWLHGAGDRGAGFWWLSKAMSGMAHVKWMLPDAAPRELSVADGMASRAWLDVKAMPIAIGEPVAMAELDAAVDRVLEIVEAQRTDGISPGRIILGGFSQGALVAAMAAARCPHQLAGVVLWSGYVGDKAAELTAALRARAAPLRVAPVWACHGANDNKVLPESGKALVDALKASGVPLTSKVYAGVQHGCSPEQVDELKALLAKTLPAAETAAGKPKKE